MQDRRHGDGTAETVGWRRRSVAAVAMFAVATVGVLVTARVGGGRVGLYGAATFTYLAVKLALSVLYRPARDGEEPPPVRAAVVVPLYNEDPGAFAACLDSLRAQTRRPDEVWVVDDGSTSDTCARLARQRQAAFAAAGVVLHVARFPVNRGKRHAQAHAFRRSGADVFVTVDSDTVLDPHALAEGLKPFRDPRVMAATGRVRALNATANLLTRLIDLRYANAFLYERAAYSALGAVLCCCGSLSFYRSRIVQQNLADFVHQRFLGVEVHYGDDRRLTNYALREGRVVFQATCLGHTAVPERFGHWLRQQLRWNKSFIRETWWCLTRFRPWSWPWVLSALELTTWVAMSVALVFALVVRSGEAGLAALWFYGANAAFLAYARSVRYIGEPDLPLARQIGVFLLAPLYAVVHVFVLIPLRLVAFATLRRTGWGTRSTVEVVIDLRDRPDPTPGEPAEDPPRVAGATRPAGAGTRM